MWYRDVVSQRGISTQERVHSSFKILSFVFLGLFTLTGCVKLKKDIHYAAYLFRFQCKIVITQGLRFTMKMQIINGHKMRKDYFAMNVLQKSFSPLSILSSSWSREFTRSGASSMRRSPCCCLRTLYRKAASSSGSEMPCQSPVQRRRWSARKVHSCSRYLVVRAPPWVFVLSFERPTQFCSRINKKVAGVVL